MHNCTFLIHRSIFISYIKYKVAWFDKVPINAMSHALNTKVSKNPGENTELKTGWD